MLKQVQHDRKEKILTKKIGPIIKIPKETVSEQEIDRKRAEYIALLLKWKMKKILENKK